MQVQQFCKDRVKAGTSVSFLCSAGRQSTALPCRKPEAHPDDIVPICIHLKIYELLHQSRILGSRPDPFAGMYKNGAHWTLTDLHVLII